MALQDAVFFFLQELLVKSGIDKDEILECVQVKNFASGDIASNHDAVTIKLKDNVPDINLFLKFCKEGSVPELFNIEISTFDKEVEFYERIFPALCKFEADKKKTVKGNASLANMFFKFYGSGYVKESFYIALERFSPDSFYVTAKPEFHSPAQINCVLKSLAVFHSTSYCMKHQCNIDFLKEYPLLADKCFNPGHHEVTGPYFMGTYKQNISIMKAVLTEIKNGNSTLLEKGFSQINFTEDSIERLEKLSDMIMFILHNTLDCDDEFKVVCHGDFHMWNLAFPKNSNGDPRFFDFQIIRFSSAITDVHQYLSQVSTPTMRKEHLQDFLQTYYNAFLSSCQQFDLNDDLLFTFDKMMKEYEYTAAWGFLYGFIFIMPRFVHSDFYASLKDAHNSHDIVKLLNEKGKPDVWNAINIYSDFLCEAGQLKTFDLMEKLSFT